MMPGSMDPKKMQKMMKQMGLKTQQVDAEKVKIEGKDNYVVKNPQVTLIDMKGKKTFQIMGDIQEGKSKPYTDEDVEMVMDKGNVSKEEAEKALEATEGDIAEAITGLS